jgi:predicted small lipoprotein YifL
LAPLGALALVFLLAGCGIKGPLEPPPSETPPPRAQIVGQPPAPPPDGEVPPQPARQRIFLDWLLD